MISAIEQPTASSRESENNPFPAAELAAIEPVLRRIGIAAIVAKNRERAHAILDELFAAQEAELITETTVADMGFETRVAELLEKFYETFWATELVAEVLKNPFRLKEIRGMGPQREQQVIAICQAFADRLAATKKI